MATVALVQRANGRHRSFYYESFNRLPEITAVAVVDPEGATFAEAQAAVRDKPLRTYPSLEAMTRAEDAAMAIVTFTAAESPLWIQRVLEARLPALIEKPACIDVADFARLVELAARRNLPLMLAMCNRTAPVVEDARRIVAQGGVGRLYAARVLALADQARIWRERTRDWTFHKADAAGGHLIFLGIHWLDALLHITQARVREVQAFTGNVGGGPIDVEDLATVNLRLEGGAQATVTSGYVLDADKQIDLSLWGADGWLRFDFNARRLEWYATHAAMRGVAQRTLTYDTTGGDYPTYVRECLRACLGEVAPPITGPEALELLKVIFAAYRSADTGATVKL
ncbi:MAG: Gfo/Idh/MocA family oxidoreductase [Actinobacteria bacterium]|nr:Gfo/Idh/MocA family oxidoreductase [Actinomycetota bacterium]